MPWPDMPKHVAKDLFFQALEKRYADPATAKEALEKLRATVPGTANPSYEIADIGSLTAAAAPAGFTGPQGGPPQTRKDHLNNDWFGKNGYSVNGGTGWWIEWQGNAEGVFRETLIRALEVAFNIPNGAAVPDPPPQPHPLDFYWICGLPRFESFISWNNRQVTVLILTPGFTSEAGGDFKVADFPPPGSDQPGQLDNYVQNRNPGMIFVGQDVQRSNKLAVTMNPGVVVERMHWLRGGVGAP